MYLTFNEISFQPFSDNEYTLRDRYILMSKTLKKANDKFGFSHIVFPTKLAQLEVTNAKTFHQWASSLDSKDRNKIFAVANRKPFSNDVLQDQIGELDSYYFENKELKIEQNYCVGLATAHILETATISLSGISFWEQEQIKFHKENTENNTQNTVRVYNLSTETSIDNKNFSVFAENIADVQLIETSILPKDKPIHFRDDHGKDKLKEMANRLVNSKHVTEVINSIRFNNRTVRFIRKIHQDGKIEIVLHWEDAGYGMIIQTTGRNFRETKVIAEKLKNEYDK